MTNVTEIKTGTLFFCSIRSMILIKLTLKATLGCFFFFYAAFASRLIALLCVAQQSVAIENYLFTHCELIIYIFRFF